MLGIAPPGRELAQVSEEGVSRAVRGRARHGASEDLRVSSYAISRALGVI